MIKCRFENGDGVSLRHVVVDGLIIRGNQILLVKRAEKKLLEGRKYALPGGFLDRDETCEQAMKREIKEETGYEVEGISFFKFIDNPNRRNEDRQNVTFIFTVEVGKKVSEPDDEVSEVKWFDLDNLPKEEEIAFDHYEIIQSYLKSL